MIAQIQKTVTFKKYLVIFTLIILFDFFFFFKLFFPVPQSIITPELNGGDTLIVQLPYKYELCKNVRQFKLPFWVQNMAHGYPLVAGGEVGAFNPLSVLPCFFFDYKTAFHVQIVLQTLVAQIGVVLLGSFLLLNAPAIIYFSILFPFLPIYLMNYMQVSLIYPVFFLPYILACIKKLIDKIEKKWIVLLILSITSQFLTSHLQMFSISTLFVGVFLLCLFFFMKEKRKVVFITCISYVIGLLLSAIQLIPSYQFYLNSNRNTQIYRSLLNEQNVSIKNILSLFSPTIPGSWIKGTFPYESIAHPWEATFFIYYVPLLFLLLGIYFLLKSKKDYFLTSIFIATTVLFLLSFGSRSPLSFLFSLPFFSVFRYPTRCLLIVVFILSLVSTFGFNYIYTKIVKREKIVRIFFLLFVYCALFFESWNFMYSFHILRPSDKVFEKEQSPFLNQIKHSKLCNLDIDIRETSSKHRSLGYEGKNSIYQYSYIFQSVRSMVNLIYEIPSCNAVHGFLPKRMSIISSNVINDRTIDLRANTASFSKNGIELLRNFGADYFISKFRFFPHPDVKLISTYTDKNFGYTLYLQKITQSQNRFYFAESIRPVVLLEDFFNKISAHTIRGNTYVEDITTLENLKQEKDVITRIIEKNNTNTLFVSTHSRAFLVINQNFYPGWNAFVDGKEVKTYRVNIVNWGFFVPAGTHTIIIRHIPFSFYLGLVISTTTLFLLALYFISPTKKLEVF